ncbi:hypothetical protein I317_05848 [Kwoniella heveanensis CBS 569]|nr:hypothetical protein I317_05848 [Kwoniella heveanensis CBS 569]
MDGPPVTLNVVKISPPSLISSYIPHDGPLPSSPRPLPSPPIGFSFSPTPNYPAPFGFLSLGSTLSLELALENTHTNRQDVLGVKMMVEVQGPSGRYRLGEVIHSSRPVIDASVTKDEEAEGEQENEQLHGDASPAGEERPALSFGDSVVIQVESEMKDLGMNVIIISVAWETLDGRRTMQRFLKLNVNPPLAIKTRIQTPSHPNTALSREKREDVYLEVLMQNVSNEGMRLANVFLEAVQGLKSRSITRDHRPSSTSLKDEVSPAEDSSTETLLPNDTKQYLFVLSPDQTAAASPAQKDTPRSIFPPTYPAGTILPLGRLDVSWVSGVYHVPGRLQTSTLNRRFTAPPPVTKGLSGPGMARTLSSQSASGSRPGQPNVLNTPLKERGSLLAPNPLHGKLREDVDAPQWEFDLTLEGEREVEMEKKFKLALKLGVRSIKPIINDQTQKGYTVEDKADKWQEGEEAGEDDDDDVPLNRRTSRLPEHDLPPPPPPRIAVQYLTPLPSTSTTQTIPSQPSGPSMQVSVQTPSQTSTPLSHPTVRGAPATAEQRSFTPMQQSAQGSSQSLAQSLSRPGTPLSTQLRLAQSQALASSTNASVAGSAPGTPRIGTGFSSVFVADGQSARIGASGSGMIEAVSLPVVDFPPLPTVIQVPSSRTPNNTSIAPPLSSGTKAQVIQIGNSLLILPSQPLSQVLENTGPSYTEDVLHKRWETTFEFELEFIAFDEGLAGLGGLRVLILENNSGAGDQPEFEAQSGISGHAAREWESLGDLTIWG